METINILYWTARFDPSLVNFNDFNTLVHPIFLHALPLVFLMIDASLNTIVFEYATTWKYSLYVIVSYLPMLYLGEYAMGFLPYSFINFKDYMTVVWMVGSVALNMICFFATALIQNQIKRSSTLAPTVNFLDIFV